MGGERGNKTENPLIYEAASSSQPRCRWHLISSGENDPTKTLWARRRRLSTFLAAPALLSTWNSWMTQAGEKTYLQARPALLAARKYKCLFVR